MQPYDINASATELKNIQLEIKRLKIQLKLLKDKETSIKTKIDEFLQKNNHKGVIVSNCTVIRETKTKKKPLTKIEKTAEWKTVLTKFQIENPDKVINELSNIRSQNVTTSNIKITY